MRVGPGGVPAPGLLARGRVVPCRRIEAASRPAKCGRGCGSHRETPRGPDGAHAGRGGCLRGTLGAVIVVDASVLANVVGGDGPDGKRARQEFRASGDVAAPDLVDVETVAVLRRRWLDKTISAVRFGAAIDDLEDLTIERYPTLSLMLRAYRRDNVTACNATYVALAEALGCQLLTSDQRLSTASGPRCSRRLLR